MALGGNALGNSPAEQLLLVKNTAKPIVDLVEKGYEIVIVLRVVNDHIELIAQVEQVLDYIASLPEQERRIINYDAQMTALENEIKRYQDLKINLYSDMADGVISREEYKEFHAGYDRRIADRQRQLGKLKDERSQAMENSSGNIEWIEQFKKYRHLTELDRECIVHLIEKILIYDGMFFYFYVKFVFTKIISRNSYDCR